MYHNLLILVAVFTLYQSLKLRKAWVQFSAANVSREERFNEYCKA